MQVKASIAVVFLAISGSAIAYTVTPLKDAIAPKAPIADLINFSKALAASSQTPAVSKSGQNARLVRTLPIQGFSVLSPTDPILATYRRAEKTHSEGDKKITIFEQTNENIITLTNIDTGEEIRRISYDSPSEFKSLIFSPDGRLLASHTYNPHRETLTIRLWDVSTGREFKTLRRLVKAKTVEGNGIDYPANSALAFSPDGQSLISIAGGNSAIYIWDLAANSLQKNNEIKKESPIFLINKSPQKTLSATNSLEESVQKDRQRFDYELADYKIVKDSLEAGKTFEAIKTLLRQRSKMVQYWRRTEPTAVYQAKTDFYVDLITRIITQSYVFEKSIAVLEELGTDTNEGKRRFTGEGFVIEKSGEDFMLAANNGQRVILQTIKGNFSPIPYPSFQDVVQVKALVNKLLNQGNLRLNLTGHEGDIMDFVFSPNSQILASASTDKTIKVWNLKTGKIIYTLTGNSPRNSKLAISPDSRILVTVGTNDDNLEKNQMKLWDLKTGKLIRIIPVSGLVSSIRFTSDGKKIINIANSPFISTQIQIRDANTGKLIYPSVDMGDPKNSTFSIAISPDEKTYAVAGQERSFHIRDLMTGKTITSFGMEELTVDYTADGKSLVTSGREGIKVWQ
jgi:WD40 repeat protein